MGQVLHGCATTTEVVRRAIQHSQESLRGLAKRYGINPKTVAKWKARETVGDRPAGPREARSTSLTVEDEAVVVAFRRHTLLPLDDCLYALQATIPHLTRSSLHRCLLRHGISRLPEIDGDKPGKRKFKTYARLLPHRHRRSADGGRQAAPLRRDRPLPGSSRWRSRRPRPAGYGAARRCGCRFPRRLRSGCAAPQSAGSMIGIGRLPARPRSRAACLAKTRRWVSSS